MAVLSDHFEQSAFVAAPADSVFAYADDPARLSSHMSESSWMMGGGRMQTELDAARGQTVGSRIRLSGKVFGLELSVEEIVTERVPPERKAWQTTGSPRLLVIGHYRMGFEIASQENGSLLRVYIDYSLPKDAPERWLGFLLGGYYAQWCTQQMVHDTVEQFASFQPKSQASIRRHRRSAQLVKHHPRRFISAQFQLTLEQKRRYPTFIGRHQIRSPKPQHQRDFGCYGEPSPTSEKPDADKQRTARLVS